MSYLHILDTNVFREWIDEASDRHTATRDHVSRLGSQFVYVSSITLGEVEFGLSRSSNLNNEQVDLIRSAIQQFPILTIDRHTAEPYGRLRAYLLQHFAPRNRRSKLKSLSQLTDPITDLTLGIQENDLWLASQAIAHNAVLVTLDRMTRIREAAEKTGQRLQVVRW